MQPISYQRHQFPPAIIRHAIWLYLRLTLSYRDVEQLLTERGRDVSSETVRRRVRRFVPALARNLRRLRSHPAATWHLDEIGGSIQGRRMYLWRAVDSEGEILDVLVQPRQDKAAADAGWALIEPLMLAARRIGRPRMTCLRTVVDAILYLASTDCQRHRTARSRC